MADKQNKNKNLENSKTIKSKTSKRKITKKYLKERYKTLKQKYDNLATWAYKFHSNCYRIIEKFLVSTVDIYIPKTEEEKIEFCHTYKFNKNILETLLDETIKKYSLNVKYLKKHNSKSDIDNKTYKVGYKKPPIETRFQKGDKGNPKGRKPKEDEGLLDLIEKKLQEPITVTKNGKTIRVPKKEIVTEQITKSLVNGTPIHKNNIDLVKYMDKYSNNKKSLNEIFGKNRS